MEYQDDILAMNGDDLEEEAAGDKEQTENEENFDLQKNNDG